MGNERPRIAVVTGATRGIGRGIAAALGERGWVVYVTGRTAGPGERTVDATARLVERSGGTGIPVRVDHSDDEQVAALFRQVADERGHLDLLVNNVYKIPDPPAWTGGFWEHPVSIWDDQVGIGLRAHYVASWHAAPLLFAAAPGSLIVNVSSPGGAELPLQRFLRRRQGRPRPPDRRHGHRAAGDRCRCHCPLPGIGGDGVRGGVGRAAGRRASTRRRRCCSSGDRSPRLADAQDLAGRSGTIQWVEDLAEEFDVVDEHGRRPPGYSRRLERSAPVP